MRRAAVEELALEWKDDPDTLPLRRDRAVNDPTLAADVKAKGKDYLWIGRVRDAAIEAIFRGWPDDPNTLLLLRERAKNDPTLWLREKAKQWADEIEARGQMSGFFHSSYAFTRARNAASWSRAFQAAAYSV